VVDQLAAGLHSLGVDRVRGIEVSENVAASERAVHLDLASPVDSRSLSTLAKTAGLTGLSMSADSGATSQRVTAGPGRVQVVAGDPHVSDVLSFGDRSFTLRRHVVSFFQGNRYLLRDLAAHVIDWVEPEGPIVDLFAGVGLFAVSAAIGRGVRVVAVEGDRTAARDLEANARDAGDAVEVICQPVEVFGATTRMRPHAVILDPPRTGVSRTALEGVIGLGADRIIYVSCDVATLARDARHLVDAGYTIGHVQAFDLFPNTPHVETVAVLDRSGP
jgi:23S rRNA (uracil1939-C5)-methyltransferase